MAIGRHGRHGYVCARSGVSDKIAAAGRAAAGAALHTAPGLAVAAAAAAAAEELDASTNALPATCA
eukprot:353906-Chlamydomonas_euryale.AAC.3